MASLLIIVFFYLFGFSLASIVQNTTSYHNSTEGLNSTILDYHRSSCTDVRQLFVMRHIGSADLVPELQVKGDDIESCPSSKSCCTQLMVERYNEAAKKDFRNMLQASSSYLKTLIASSATKFRDNFLEMIRVSENNTNHLFSDVYKKMDSAARTPVIQLYQDFQHFISGRDVDLEEKIKQFFDSLFPLVYHHSINPKLKDFSEDYKDCLRQTQREIQPFGDIAKKVTDHLSQSLDSARLFLEALNLGVEVTNSTEHLELSEDCSKALFRLTYCAHCRSMPDAKPCSGFCLNVIRGCLSAVAELDQPWNGYINSLEHLASNMAGPYDIEETLGSLDSKISEAIMYAMENGPELSKKVKAACGHPRRATREVAIDPVPESPRKIVSIRSADTTLAIKIQTFMHKLAESKGYHANLADKMCSYDSMSGKRGEPCWNGEVLGEYSKTIAGIGITAQKFNPEIKSSSSQDVILSTLMDKLIHVKQLLNNRMTSLPQSDSYTMEGSGSGGWGKNKFGDDEDYHDGSGSGDFGARRDEDFNFSGGDNGDRSQDHLPSSHQNQEQGHREEATKDGNSSVSFNCSLFILVTSLTVNIFLKKYSTAH